MCPEEGKRAGKSGGRNVLEQQLRTWGFCSLEKKRMRGNLIPFYLVPFYAMLRREDGEKEVLNSSPCNSVI